MALSIGILAGSTSRLAGGLFTSVRRSAQVLAAQGCAVTVYGLRDRHSEEDLAAWEPLKPVLFDRAGPAILGYAPGLTRALGDHDVLHQHGIWQFTSQAANAWRKRTGRPVMISPRGMLDPWAVAHSRWKKRIAQVLFEGENLRRAACIHALCLSEARAIRAFGLDNPIAVIPNGVDLPREDCAPRGQGAEGERRTLMFLGRLHPKKGIAQLLDAWEIVAREQPALAARWCLTIAGWDDGGHLEGLRARAAALPSYAQVDFPGQLYGEAKHREMREAAAFILPSFSEGLPMAVLEAWSYALPVLMTEECNLPEGFAANAAVRIVNEPAALADALLNWLEHPELAQYGARGRALCEARFTWDSVAARHLPAYRWMLGEGPRPDCVIARGAAVPEG